MEQNSTKSDQISPNMKYLAIFCPSQYQDSENSFKNGRAMGVEKTFKGLQDTGSMMFQNRNLLLNRLPFQK